MSSLSTHILKKVEEELSKKNNPLPPCLPYRKLNENNEEAAEEYQNFVDGKLPGIKTIRTMSYKTKKKPTRL